MTRRGYPHIRKGTRTVWPAIPHELLHTAHRRLGLEPHGPSTSRDEQELHKRLRHLRNLQQQRRLRRWRRLFGLLFPRGGQLTCDTFVVVMVVVVIGWRGAAHHLVTLVDRRAGWRVIDSSEGRARARWQRSNLDRDGSDQRREGSLAVRQWSEVVVHGEEKVREVR